jgi:uncharacterized membrane protein
VDEYPDQHDKQLRRWLLSPRVQKVGGILSIVFGVLFLIQAAVNQVDGGNPGFTGWGTPIVDVIIGLYLLRLSRHGRGEAEWSLALGKRKLDTASLIVILIILMIAGAVMGMLHG